VKTSVKSILISSILAIVTSSSMVAQTGQFDQWSRAKYGRPSPAEQIGLNAPQANPVAPVTAQPTIAVTQFDEWYRAKYGRPSPAERQSLQIAQRNTVVAQPTVAVSAVDLAANTPAEHERIAQNYRNQAQDYLAQAKQHEAMVAVYKANPSLTAKNQAGTINHCEYFVAKFNEMAAKSQQLAELHDQMAKNAAKN